MIPYQSLIELEAACGPWVRLARKKQSCAGLAGGVVWPLQRGAKMELVGTVQKIARYPVKSMRGEEMESVHVGLQGLPGDRAYAFVQESLHTPFPWLTARQYQGLLRHQTSWRETDGTPQLEVRFEDNSPLAITDDALLQRIQRESGINIRLHSDYRGNHDVAYVSIITRATIQRLCEEGGVAADHRRFRMNFVIDSDLPPFAERQWAGRTLQIGACRLVITEPDQRCVMVTFDPETGEGTPAVLKAVAALNGASAGVYASVALAADVAIGDAVTLC